jgi:hypothetical protein
MITIKLSKKQYALLKALLDKELGDFCILAKKSENISNYYDLLFETKVALLMKKE